MYGFPNIFSVSDLSFHIKFKPMWHMLEMKFALLNVFAFLSHILLSDHLSFFPVIAITVLTENAL